LGSGAALLLLSFAADMMDAIAFPALADASASAMSN
jgi:uncharacterized membrane protein YoaK (UPF0700 family)